MTRTEAWISKAQAAEWTRVGEADEEWKERGPDPG